jgi:anthranilate synthase component I
VHAIHSTGRLSDIAGPRKVLKTGPGHGPATDPMPLLEEELAKSKVATVPGLKLPPLTGGAVGYVSYDCVKYFEPRTKRDLKDIVNIPESLFMLFDTVVAFDHFFQVVKIISYLEVPHESANLDEVYRKTKLHLQEVVSVIQDSHIPVPEQPSIKLNNEYTSNIGQTGYENHVKRLKEHICKG